MPTYEFVCNNKKCASCGDIIEVFWVRYYDGEQFYCEHCGLKLKKIISEFSFELKGNGWHKTDYPS
jgi:putative FmdB family regulatory protein